MPSNRSGGRSNSHSHSHSRGLSRRAFVQAAVAIGGSAALAACQQREETTDISPGPADLASLPDRQHAWNAVLPTDEHGNVRSPRQHVLLLLDYARDGTPTDADRETVEAALQSLEHAYARDHEGLLFTVGYSPAYFARFDAALPDPVDLPEPEPLAPFEDPVPDRPDAIVHLASDFGSVVLAAEAALMGERDEVNGHAMAADLKGVFRDANLADGGLARRTGFVGAGLPAENQDVEGIPDADPVPEESPLYMGFKSNFKENQASEDRVTIAEGPFASGTTQHVSQIHLHLDQWYEQDSRYHREATMFCPVHAEDDRIEGVGDNLGTDTAMDECAQHVEDHAREYGVVGHSQKSAQARVDDEPLMLRRDFDSTDGGQATLHFLSLQASIADFVETREAMNGTDVADESAIGQRTNNGILQYMTVTRRGNYLMPPRDHRALPRPRQA